jgi:signal transduction histidine kinase/ActR/RegA family two-component response regulator
MLWERTVVRAGVDTTGRDGTPRRWLLRSSELLDAFVSPEYAPGSDEASRARMAPGFAFLMCVVFGLLALAHVAAGRAREASLNLTLAVVTCTAPFVMRRKGRYLLALHLTLATCLVLLTFIAVDERGPGISAPTVGLAELPLFATLLAGARVGGIWAVVSSLVSVGIGLVAMDLPRRIQPVERLNDHVVLVIVTWTLFLVAALYERGRSRQLARIRDLEAKRHADDLDRLRTIAEGRVAQAERLASLGRVAAAVAHEINNPLAYVLANLEYLESLPDAGRGDRARSLRDAIEGARVVRRIVADLYSFTRGSGDSAGTADVVAAIRLALKMAEPHLRTKATLEEALPTSLFVRGEGVRLTQVFLNLVVNAAQAMPDEGGGKNTVRVIAETHGGEVKVEVIDTGEGIPPEVIERVTDEFFTTKPTGQGLGLGLALTHETLAKMGGRLEFESVPGRTTARVWLLAGEPPPPPAPEVRTQSTKLSVRRRVLIVDDEVSLGRSLARILRHHDVTLATSGREALALIQGGHTCDLVLCDVMMPEMTGMDLYESLETERPEWLGRFVFMTGGTYTARARQFQERIPNLFLPKPIDSASLVHAIESACQPSP